jgi:hypothetical protein
MLLNPIEIHRFQTNLTDKLYLHAEISECTIYLWSKATLYYNFIKYNHQKVQVLYPSSNSKSVIGFWTVNNSNADWMDVAWTGCKDQCMHYYVVFIPEKLQNWSHVKIQLVYCLYLASTTTTSALFNLAIEDFVGSFLSYLLFYLFVWFEKKFRFSDLTTKYSRPKFKIKVAVLKFAR